MPPPRRRRSPLLWIAIAAAGVLLIGGIGVAVLVVATSGPSGPVKADDCIDASFEMGQSNRAPASLRVKCDGDKAEGKVLKVADQGHVNAFRYQVRPQPDCPDGTDGVANVRTGTKEETVYVACVRNLKGPHPGDPGAGGAFIGAGDCVSGGALGLGGREKPCSDDDWYGKVIARVDTDKSCPAKTLETMTLRSSTSSGEIARPVLCIGPGGQVLSENDCISDPTYRVGNLSKVDCSGSQAVAKVTGRTKTKQECPAGTTHNMTSKGEAYLPVLCLKQIRPTLNERIRNLGS